jgi:hypothetical protein
MVQRIDHVLAALLARTARGIVGDEPRCRDQDGVPFRDLPSVMSVMRPELKS